MKGYLYQLFGEGIEELYWFPIQISEDNIKEAYRQFEQSESDDFEEFWYENFPDLEMERVFVEEVYV